MPSSIPVVLTDVQPVPVSTGIGLRAQHHAEILELRPSVGWFEAHSENYFAAGGTQPYYLESVRANYPLSLHGVGLSLGASDELDPIHLGHLRRLVERYQPFLVSEHLCWGRFDGRHYNDLLPLPYTQEALRLMVRRVNQLQEYLGRQILIENVSSYLEFQCSEMPEWDFLAALATQSGCGILLDVNNIYVSACNHGFDASRYLESVPVGAVAEIHLAGHASNDYHGREILIDTHGTAVCNEVWDLYAIALRRFGPVPTLIEWDTDIPALDILVAEAHHADRLVAASRKRNNDLAA